MICKWAEDSQRLIMGYLDEIRNCPSEIYHHALPFCPPSSWLHEYYNPELLAGVKVVRGFQTTWRVCSRTVSFDDVPRTLAHWKDIVAVGFQSGQIIILDAVTGIQMSVLSGHTQLVRALTFSLDGTSLVSGSDDMTIKLWDIQTGGVIKSPQVTGFPIQVSISMDNAMMACLYQNGIIELWDTNTGGTHVITNHGYYSTNFSPTSPRLLFVVSSSRAVLQWNIDGPEPHGDLIEFQNSKAAFSFDGTCWISSQGSAANVYNSDSGALVARLQIPGSDLGSYTYWFIFPNGKYVACGAGSTVFVWDITGPDPHIINMFIGHTDVITSISFSFSLISSSNDKSIKFWQMGASPKEPIVFDKEPLSSASPPLTTISLQAKDNVAILVERGGVVRTWDLSTGLCRASFSTKAFPRSKREVWLIGDRVIFVWCTTKQIHIWDTKGRKHHQIMDLMSDFSTTRLRISGDGSKVFVLDHEYLQALSTQTGEVIGKVRLEGEQSGNPLTVDGSRVWVHFMNSQTQGWDFGSLTSAPVPLSDPPPHSIRPHLNFINCTRIPGAGPSRVEDTVTRKEVFRLTGRFMSPIITEWDGRFLVAGYHSGECQGHSGPILNQNSK